MTIPLEEGFTVVTGPNGSGKSNILDGVLFCLGLATSRGMRADRLPDLVNSGVLRAGKSAETVVSVRFDLTDWEPDPAEDGLEPPEDGPWITANQKEWTVTRRLRVMPGGSYSSSYSADGETCNLQQLQTQLRRLRIDPEGSNVVMQGDVTRIVSMSNRDRRGLIDELAGVALFDNRIEQTRTKLNDVKERQERCQIVEQELLSSKQRLERDCAKAKKYQELRDQLQLGRKQELVLSYEVAQQDLIELKTKQKSLGEQSLRDADTLKELEKKLAQSVEQLKVLQENVKALGEDKLLAVQGELAGLETQTRELERQAGKHKQEGEKLQQERQALINRRQAIQADEKVHSQDQDHESNALEEAEQTCRDAEAAVEVSRRRLGEVAGRSGAWFEDQCERTQKRQTLQARLRPLQLEHQKLEERLLQVETRKKELQLEEEKDISENQKVHQKLQALDEEWIKLLDEVKSRKEQLDENIEAFDIQKRTRLRLEQEQARLEKDIARLESRKETLQESRGTGALRLLLEAGLEGIHGSVSQLGDVEDRYRLALEVAAGARLGHVVVDDDRIAARAIETLKRRRAGRLTFLPLNRINNTRALVGNALKRAIPNSNTELSQGLIGKAFDLVNYESIYSDVFAYVFGETLVFSDLNSARSQLAKTRAVTLDGDLLEKTGAMTGGSFSGRSLGLSFGRSNEGDELEPLRQRLLELGEALVSSRQEESRLSRSIDVSRDSHRQLEQRQAGLDAERTTSRRSNQPILERSKERSERLKGLDQTQQQYQENLQVISKQVSPLIQALEALEALEKKEQVIQLDGDSKSWRRLQEDLEKADKSLGLARLNRDGLQNQRHQRQLALERVRDQQSSLVIEETKLQDSVKALAEAHRVWREQQNNHQNRRKDLQDQQQDLQNRFGEERRARDAVESDVAKKRQQLQEDQWKLQRLRDDVKGLEEEIRSKSVRLQELEHSLPDPPPEITDDLRQEGLEALQAALQRLQLRMESLEPVNMLALEELAELEKRLFDLVEKLGVLSNERSELLLRIETVATLRQEAFMEAFEAVDKHFREIFASLSDGDGHLQLDNSEDPLDGGLTLVAHPKGKTVRRLAAMSGGEKSLTALSFLFALQRFRPSPFYALDEVDSFLDGVNVERLSALIARQADQAQFLVVSHRRPMIGASSRTIGVTQARGSHTQVVGLPDAA